MGQVLSSVWSWFNSKRERKICIIGLHNAGKTSILYRMHLGKIIITQPTIGCNIEEIRHNNVRFQAWDLGGQETLRNYWSTYFTATNAIIFVVDSSDRNSAVVSKMELYNALNSEDLKQIPLLVFSNKKDLPNCLSEAEIVKVLNLEEIKDRNWQIQACSAVKNEGLREGFDWLVGEILK